MIKCRISPRSHSLVWGLMMCYTHWLASTRVLVLEVSHMLRVDGIHLSSWILIELPFETCQSASSFIRSLLCNKIAHAQKTCPHFVGSIKLVLGKYQALKVWAHKESGSCTNLQQCFAIRARLNSWIFLDPSHHPFSNYQEISNSSSEPVVCHKFDPTKILLKLNQFPCRKWEGTRKYSSDMQGQLVQRLLLRLLDTLVRGLLFPPINFGKNTIFYVG